MSAEGSTEEKINILTAKELESVMDLQVFGARALLVWSEGFDIPTLVLLAFSLIKRGQG